LPTTNARWRIKGSKDGDFYHSLLKEQEDNFPLEFFSEALMTSSKNNLTSLSPDVTSKESNPKVACLDFEVSRLSALEGLNRSLALSVEVVIGQSPSHCRPL